MAEIHGHWEERFDGVAETLSDSIDAGTDLGASVAVLLDGEPVVDCWGGHADPDRTAPWSEHTLTNVWSTTKTMTFLCALMLADRGELDFHAPVSRYWPEFAANGKEGVEVRHLLGHTAGLPGWDEPLAPEDLADWDRCVTALAAQAPWWEPGTSSGYHAVTQGYLVGEVVRRITGATIGTWFAAEVAAPLGADFWIGLPESEDHRVSVVVPPERMELDESQITELVVRAMVNPPLDATYPAREWWRRAEIPAANGHGNARSVALVQSVVAGRGQARGVRLVSEALCEAIFEEQAHGRDLILGMPVRFGMGYGLSSEGRPIGPRACYWGGFGGSSILMDLDQGLTVCYVMNRMDGSLLGDLRSTRIEAAVQAGLARN